MSAPRRTLAVLGAVTIAVSAIAVQWAAAEQVTGITNARFGAEQSFGVQRSPAYPTCSDANTYNAFTVSAPSAPFSEAVGGAVDLGTNYLMIQDSGDVTAPWAIAMFNASGAELRWSGTAWVTAAEVGGTFTTEEKFAPKGQIFGASEEGLLHDSVPSGFGTFFSPNSVLVGSRTYTPTASLNDCVNSQAVGANLGNLPVNDDPISSTTTTPTTDPSPTTSTTSPVTSTTAGPTTTAVPSGTVTPRFTG